MGSHEDPLYMLPPVSRILFSGRSGSGKTTNGAAFLTELMDTEHGWDRIILVCPSALTQPLWVDFWEDNELDDDDRHTVYKTGMIDELQEAIRAARTEGEEGDRVLLILDDLAAENVVHEGSGRQGEFADVANNARHIPLSVWVFTQNLTSVSPSFRDNADALVLFRTFNLDEIKILQNQLNPILDKEKYLEVYNQCIRSDEGYLFQLHYPTPQLWKGRSRVVWNGW